MCKRDTSCTLNKDTGLGTAFTLAHETAHRSVSINLDQQMLFFFREPANSLSISQFTKFKIYDATVTKTAFKIASAGLVIFFVIMSVCLISKN